jgi:hypothetical protein
LLAAIGSGAATGGLAVTAATASAAPVSITVSCSASSAVAVGSPTAPLFAGVHILPPPKTCATPEVTCPADVECALRAYGIASDTAGGAGVTVDVTADLFLPVPIPPDLFGSQSCRTAYSLIRSNSCLTPPVANQILDRYDTPTYARCIWKPQSGRVLFPDFGVKYTCVLTVSYDQVN